MCNILCTFNIDKDKVNKLIKNMSIKGRDGYGYYYTKDNKETVQKFNKSPEAHKTIEDDFDLLIANSRAVPTTEYETNAGFDVKNLQPFSNDKYVVVHNGIISNDKELKKEYKLNVESEVDTAILPDLFSKLGVIKTLKTIRGSFAIICYDKLERRIYFGKNFLPLVYTKKDNKLIITSLKKNIPVPNDYIIKEVQPYTCHEYNLITNKEIKYKLLEKAKTNKVLILFSGGTDSVVLAYLYKKLGYDITLIYFKYKCSAEKVEIYSAAKISKKLKCKLILYDVKDIFNKFKNKSELLYKNKPDKNKKILDAESTKSYVPNRNAIFLMIASAYAELHNYNIVSIGVQQGGCCYPDSNPGFIKNINKTLKYSLNVNTNIKISAPFINLVKHEIVALGKKLSVPFNDICSCYYPKLIKNKIINCNNCGCCQARETAFKMNKEKDFITDLDNFIKKYIKL